MPVQPQKSILAGILGAELVSMNAEAATKPKGMGSPQLPAGIEGGIAEITELKFGKFESGANVGQPYFMGTARVLTPLEHKGVRCVGLTTKIGPEAICATPKADKRKTKAEHWAWVVEQLWRLGIDCTPKAGDSAAAVEARILAAMEKAKKDKICTKFRTSLLPKQRLVQRDGKWYCLQGKREVGGYPTLEVAKRIHPYALEPGEEGDDRVYHEWNGETPRPEVNGSVTLTSDNSGEVDNGESPYGSADEADQFPAAAEEASADSDLDTLITEALNGDGEAQEKLVDVAAEKSGKTTDEVKALDTWEEIVSLARGEAPAEEATEPEPEPEPEDTTSKVGFVHTYFPMVKGPGGKTVRGRKSVQVKVKTVNAEKQTATLVNLADAKQTFVGIPWADLHPPA